jgi:hypothetical protein
LAPSSAAAHRFTSSARCSTSASTSPAGYL